MKTRPFTVPAEAPYFIVRWKTKDDMPLIYVTDISDGDMDSMAGDGAPVGESAVYKTGTFYVEVNVTGKWEIQVELE